MFTLPDLPYPASALEPYIDTQTMEIHHGRHHAAYVKNLNDALSSHPDLSRLDIKDLIIKLDSLPQGIRLAVRNQGGGHLNHSLFWTWLAPQKSSPSSQLLAALNSTFGSLDIFKEKFTASAVAHFGSGWGWLVVKAGQLSLITTPNQDSPLSQGFLPLLGVDVWEHAYYLQYQNRRAEYIEAWFNVINWTEVSGRFARL